ncbi:MAG: hypothetical protein P8Y44_11165 [Acidobacteriota bacterium]
MPDRSCGNSLIPTLVLCFLTCTVTPGVATSERIAQEPTISTRGLVPADLRFRLRSAHRLARERLSNSPGCRALFDSLGADGPTVLEGSTYGVAQSGFEQSICSERSAAAFTTVSGQRVHLCPRLFSGLTVQKAAMILIHESLHRAGLSEWPSNPAGLRSVEINTLIRDRCRL